jgi:lysophospholipid acyltransferase (LPLAT)-like uncharacterized protein
MKLFLAWLSSAVIHLIGWSLRMTIEDRGGILDQPDHPPVIIAFWHNRTALMAYFFEHYCRGRTALTFISRSRDGQFMTDVAARFGIKAVRGSSSRHGTSAMLSAIRASTNPRIDLVITPDGPRGPRYQIRPGIIRLSQATQRPIVAVTYRLKWKHQLNSWDRFHVPLPFGGCYLVTSKPILVPENASDEELNSIRDRLIVELGDDKN